MSEIDQEGRCSTDCDNAEPNHQERKDISTEEENDSSSDIIVKTEINSSGSKNKDRALEEYGYEEASPEVNRRHQERRGRRNSLVERIMIWAGVINDEQFSTGSKGSCSAQEARQAPTETSRRASMDGAIMGGGTIGYGSAAAPISQRRRFHSTDDSDFLDEQATATLDSDAHCGERRMSLHAAVERAVAYVNISRDGDDFDEDLSPFGNRRDSLFN